MHAAVIYVYRFNISLILFAAMLLLELVLKAIQVEIS